MFLVCVRGAPNVKDARLAVADNPKPGVNDRTSLPGIRKATPRIATPALSLIATRFQPSLARRANGSGESERTQADVRESGHRDRSQILVGPHRCRWRVVSQESPASGDAQTTAA